MLTIRQPVAVKVILTEETKQNWLAELRRHINSTIAELEELEFRGKQMLREAEKQGEAAVQAAQQHLENERNQRIARREQLIQQLTQIQQMDLNTEVPNGTLETTADIHIGDSWDKILLGSEIVLKDGIVVEIRRNGIKVE
ncbi:YlqD family protein [Sulfoacidibacillus thermotolerans]|uniref:YlqD family protein n=1 Tax=Sulfoacidibacillus thermotolerans TaxID=1765684 RepID=UPI001FE97988|nr:YlqD family protein [Sulfoacidibacillus thermotolerans]